MKIYQPQGKAREYSPLALNYFKGCTHGCKYCYVPNMLGRFNSDYDHSVCTPPTEDSFKELEASASKMEGCEKQILLSFTGDPYCGIETYYTTRVLETLLMHNHKVAILTKGGLRCMKDAELFKRFGDRIKVGATLTFDNAADSFGWENGAALPDERIAVLKELAYMGVKTWVSFEPVVSPRQSLSLLKKVSGIVDHVKIGKLNNYRGLDKMVDWNQFLSDAVCICRDTGLKFYIKKSLQEYNKGVYLSDEETDEDFLNI